jgi:hypothetical protein
MNDIKVSVDELPQCDAADINSIVASMTDAERAEFLAWCDETAAANRAYQMTAEDPS